MRNDYKMFGLKNLTISM